MLLNGRRIIFDDGRAPLILLAIQDITTRRDFERRARFLTEAAVAFAGPTVRRDHRSDRNDRRPDLC